MQNKYNNYGIHIKSYPILFNKRKEVLLDTKVKAIRSFTSTNYLYRLFYKVQGFSLKRIDPYKMKLCYKNDCLEFSKLSDLLIVKNEEDKNMKNELFKYKKRKGKCHQTAIELFASMGEKLVTGYVDDSSGKFRTIHSFIETEKNVIDYSSNLVISKEDYYRLMNVEVLSVITKEQFLSDCNSSFANEFLGVKFYCLFREELKKQGLLDFNKEKIYQKK